MSSQYINHHCFTIQAVALTALFSFASSGVMGLSLNEALNLQLEQPAGELPCARLFAQGGSVSGALEGICARPVPAGGAPSSGGGGAATPTALPQANMAINSDTTQTSDGKQTSARSGKWSWFLTGENESLDRNRSANEAAYESTVNRLVVGTGFRPNESAILSMAVNVSKQDGDYNNGGDFSNDTTGLRFLAAFEPTTKISLQILAAYDDISVDSTRITTFSDVTTSGVVFNLSSGTPQASYDYNQLGLSAQAGYLFRSGAFSLTTQLGFDWLNSDYGTYSEQGDSGLALTFHDDERNSLQSTFGFRGSYATSTSYGAFIPQFSVMWRHEFEDKSRDVSVSFVEDVNSTRFSYSTDDVDQDFFDASAGGVFVFAKGLQAFINIQTLISNDLYDNLMTSAGLRVEF